VEICLDAVPEVEPGRQTFGEGQFQLGFSPGNFLETGDPLVDCKPEAFCFAPAGREVENFKAPAVVREGKSYTELRIGEDWSAAIVRKNS